MPDLDAQDGERFFGLVSLCSAIRGAHLGRELEGGGGVGQRRGWCP